MAVVLVIEDDGEPTEPSYDPMSMIAAIVVMSAILRHGTDVAAMVSAIRKPDRVEYRRVSK